MESVWSRIDQTRVHSYLLMGVWARVEQVSWVLRMRRSLLFHCCSAT